MKRAFFTGLVIFLPIAITFFVVRFFLDLLTEPFIGIFEDVLNNYNHQSALLLFFARLFIILLLFLFTLLLGAIARKFFFNYFMKLMNRLVTKIPIVKSIYRLTKEVVENLFKVDETPFKKTVLISFPYLGAKVVAFFTGRSPKAVEDVTKEPLYSVFIPTAPHPISGFVLLVRDTDFKEVDISTEDVFKFLISCGTYEPEKSSDSHVLPGQTEPGKTL
ncbi:MAG: DUF502 domain-containing protein [Simkaniaceae bacterium]|nr:DUF502 domain-containing protein [Simkaniaceae bacterium]